MKTQQQPFPAADAVATNARQRAGVLLVEDDPALRNTLCSGLADEFRVIGLEEPKDFLRAVYFHRPRMVLMDLNLGGVSGLELCAELRSRPELDDVRILVITARRDNDSFLKSYTEGANGLLYKPFTLPELRARMRDVLK